MKKFGIILPVHNGGEYVKECVHSILQQTCPDLNLVILENNSNDGTFEWLQSLSDERIILHSTKEPLNIQTNWARIREIKKNEFITIIGHDDILLPHYLEEMDRLIKKHPHASLYQTHFTFINSVGQFSRICMPMDEIQSGQEFLACQMARTMDSMGTGYMMRSNDYDEVHGIPTDYPNLIFADYHLWVQLSLINYKATSPATCFKYRLHNSASKLTNGEEYRIAFEKYVHFMASLAAKNEKVKNVVEKYGHDMLMYFCESLSHRILKTPVQCRTIQVEEFIQKCKSYATILIPGQPFDPSDKFRIRIAAKLDSNAISRSIFNLYKKISK